MMGVLHTDNNTGHKTLIDNVLGGGTVNLLSYQSSSDLHTSNIINTNVNASITIDATINDLYLWSQPITNAKCLFADTHKIS